MRLFREGDIEFYAPEGDITKKLPVFYNPVMKFDRDLTIAVLRAFRESRASKEVPRYCDALAGTGIRGMRAAKEAGFDVWMNDMNPKAVELIKKNVGENGIKAEIAHSDVNLFLRQFRDGKFDAIDIDPFGSFITAFDSAVRALHRDGGLLCLTATDTAPLCGVSIKTCQRRYDAKPLRVSFAKEVGLRILIGSCARMISKYDFAFKPLLCYNHRHYFRLFLLTDNSMERADEMLKEVAYLQHCQKCDWRDYAAIDGFKERCPKCGGRLDWAGPLWSGRFADVDFLRSLSFEDKEMEKLLGFLRKEQQIVAPFYDLHHIAELNKAVTKKKSGIIGSVRKKGGKACETHFCDTGIRSSIPPSLNS